MLLYFLWLGSASGATMEVDGCLVNRSPTPPGFSVVDYGAESIKMPDCIASPDYRLVVWPGWRDEKEMEERRDG